MVQNLFLLVNIQKIIIKMIDKIMIAQEIKKALVKALQAENSDMILAISELLSSNKYCGVLDLENFIKQSEESKNEV